MNAAVKPVEFSFPVPKAPHATLHGHVTCLDGCTMVHLTTTAIGESEGLLAPLGSFVYTMPDRWNERNTISTSLCTSTSSIDYATRVSKILARRLNTPVYVGCSMIFSGLSADEEMEGLTKVIDSIIQIRQ